MEATGTEGAFPRLCDFLLERREEVLAAWERSVRSAPGESPGPEPLLHGEAPALLERLAEAVRMVEEGEPGAPGEFPFLHPLDWLEASDRRTLLRELSVLRATVLERWRSAVAAWPGAAETDAERAFHGAMDEVIARTAERAAEARAREAERERLRALDALEHGDPFLLLDHDWRIVVVNTSQELATRKPRADTLGRVLWDVWPETREPSSAYLSELTRCMEERVPVRFEEMFKPLRIWTEVTAYPAGEDGVAVFFRDVTERKRSEARAREAEKRLHARERELERFFAISPDLLTVAGRDGYFRRVNPAFSAVTGYSEAELLARPYLELVHPADREQARAEAERTLSGVPIVRFTFRLIRKDGQARWMSFNASGEEGADVFAAVGRDVTEERNRAELEQQLIGIVSHDLRNPLNAIGMATEALLRRSAELDARTLATAARIKSAGGRALALIRDLLDFTRARRPGGMAIAPEPMDLHAAVRAAVEEVRASHPDRELRLEQTGDGFGRWDPARLDQVVQNLLSNAFKYGAPDRPVIVRTDCRDDWARIEVTNEGDPIDPALLPHIFEPLRQARRTGGVGGVRGVGLGLYIVDHIVRAHGGTVDVVSTAEQGTTFVVHLPREPPAAG